MHRKLLTATMLLVALALIPRAALCDDNKTAAVDRVEPTQVVRGKTATVTGTNFSAPDTGIAVLLKRYDLPKVPPKGLDLGTCDAKDKEESSQNVFHVTVPAKRTKLADGTQSTTEITFLVPDLVPIGEYIVCVYYATDKPQQPAILGDSGHLVVTNDTSVPVHVAGTDKPVSYPEADNTYKITILGDGFSSFGPDNEVLLNGKALRICWKTPRTDNIKQDACPAATADAANPAAPNDEPPAVGTLATSHELDLQGIVRDDHKGAQKLQIRLGAGHDNISESVSVTLSPVAEATPKWVAGIVLAVLILILCCLGANRSQHEVDDKRVSLLTALLLDPDTDTYSLSKAQFYAWTAATIFGYSYLTLALSWIQGHFEFASIPDKLPGILLVSATTATVSLGVNPSKPKGASTVQPSLSDFITTGGVIAAERVQFLVWTVLGILTFLFLIIVSDPATISTLPPIPQEFLMLMGISSAGYLGGRMVRKAGPIIDSILATVSSLTLELHGRNLSKDASFQIDGEDVTVDMLAPGTANDHRPEIVAKEDGQDATLAKILRVTIATPKPAWLTATSGENETKHTLSVINPDGQRADWPYTIAASK
jgi:hypothetical protein